jgi:hypothetical protein
MRAKKQKKSAWSNFKQMTRKAVKNKEEIPMFKVICKSGTYKNQKEN